MRRLWPVLLILPVLLVGAHTWYWRSTVKRLEAGFAAWMSARRAAGWMASAGAATAGGWPLAASLKIPNVAVAGGDPDIPGGIAWSTEAVELRVALLHPGLLVIHSNGLQRLRIGDGPEIPYTADRLRLDIPLEPGVPPRRADLVAGDLRARMPGAGGAATGLTVGLLQAHGEIKPAAVQGEPVLSLSANAEAITLPSAMQWPLGSRIASLSIEAALNGPVPRTPGLTRRASGWRDGGGTLDVQRLVMGWGPMGLSAAATLALDDNLQPMGTGTARIIGYAQALDAMAENDALTRRAAATVKAVLTLIARASSRTGDTPEVEVPLTLQNRTLSMRQIPLVRIPALEWASP